jgi:hypothetical protein
MARYCLIAALLLTVSPAQAHAGWFSWFFELFSSPGVGRSIASVETHSAGTTAVKAETRATVKEASVVASKVDLGLAGRQASAAALPAPVVRAQRAAQAGYGLDVRTFQTGAKTGAPSIRITPAAPAMQAPGVTVARMTPQRGMGATIVAERPAPVALRREVATAPVAAPSATPLLRPTAAVSLPASATVVRVPHGFKGALDFQAFRQELRGGLRTAVGTDARAYLAGSAVTGRNYKTGALFDVGRKSDFDVALVDRGLWSRAGQAKVKLNSSTRTAPLGYNDLKKLGLDKLARQLSQQARRRVKFMLYESEDALRGREQPYIGL